MIFALAATTSIVITALMVVTSRARDSSKPTGLPFKGKSDKKSPKKKPINSIAIKVEEMKNQKKKLDYHLRIQKLRPDFELIWIDATPGDDGFGQYLFNFITEEQGFHDEGILTVAYRRVSLENSAVLQNVKNTYPRRCIVRIVDDSTHSSRLAILRTLQTYLVHPSRNMFGYQYIVDDASDLTPPSDDDLRPMDHFLQDGVIVSLMFKTLEDTGVDWFARNSDCALDFFSGPNFPHEAITRLGYPASGKTVDGFVDTFHHPVANDP
jgi:hypothetical protein